MNDQAELKENQQGQPMTTAEQIALKLAPPKNEQKVFDSVISYYIKKKG